MKRFFNLAKKEGFDVIVDKVNGCFSIKENGCDCGIFFSKNINDFIKELKENIMDCDPFEDFTIIEFLQAFIRIAVTAKELEA